MNFYDNKINDINFKYYERYLIDYSQFDNLPRINTIGNSRHVRIIYPDEVEKYLPRFCNLDKEKLDSYDVSKMNSEKSTLLKWLESGDLNWKFVHNYFSFKTNSLALLTYNIWDFYGKGNHGFVLLHPKYYHRDINSVKAVWEAFDCKKVEEHPDFWRKASKLYGEYIVGV